MADIAVTGVKRHRDVASEGKGVKLALIILAIVFLIAFLFLPLIVVFVEGLRRGPLVFLESFADPDALAAIRLTLLVAAIAVPFNAVFGVAAAWAIAKFEFHGKNLLLSLIDLPFSVSPVISGLVYVLLFGAQSWLGPWLKANHIEIIFAVPGIVLATVFVTFPFVAREVIPLMQAQGTSEEEASLTLGASGFYTFFNVTLPNIKWALLYGVLLCNARAMGSSAPCRWFPAISAASPTPCRSTLKFFTMNTTSPPPLPWPRFLQASPFLPSFSNLPSNGAMPINWQQPVATEFEGTKPCPSPST